MQAQSPGALWHTGWGLIWDAGTGPTCWIVSSSTCQIEIMDQIRLIWPMGSKAWAPLLCFIGNSKVFNRITCWGRCYSIRVSVGRWKHKQILIFPLKSASTKHYRVNCLHDLYWLALFPTVVLSLSEEQWEFSDTSSTELNKYWHTQVSARF